MTFVFWNIHIYRYGNVRSSITWVHMNDCHKTMCMILDEDFRWFIFLIFSYSQNIFNYFKFNISWVHIHFFCNYIMCNQNFMSTKQSQYWMTVSVISIKNPIITIAYRDCTMWFTKLPLSTLFTYYIKLIFIRHLKAKILHLITDLFIFFELQNKA